MIKTVISNNCMGGCILHENGLEFCTPTINVMIMPEEFPRFCSGLKLYLKDEVYDYYKLYGRILPHHEQYLINTYGEIPKYPIGITGDIVLVFQHIDSFEEGRAKWIERRTRVDYDNIGYLFMVTDEKWRKYGEDFLKLGLKNAVVLTEGFDIEGGHRYDVPEGYHRFDLINNKRVITQDFDIQRFLEGGYA